jgi:hypothetical protein
MSSECDNINLKDKIEQVEKEVSELKGKNLELVEENKQLKNTISVMENRIKDIEAFTIGMSERCRYAFCFDEFHYFLILYLFYLIVFCITFCYLKFVIIHFHITIIRIPSEIGRIFSFTKK